MYSMHRRAPFLLSSVRPVILKDPDLGSLQSLPSSAEEECEEDLSTKDRPGLRCVLHVLCMLGLVVLFGSSPKFQIFCH